MLKERSTYEIMNPERIGTHTRIVLGKHSGRHAFREKLKEMGYKVSDEHLNTLFQRFKELAEKKKNITDLDVLTLIEDGFTRSPEFSLEIMQIVKGMATASVRHGGRRVVEHSFNGPVDAIYKAVNSLLGVDTKLIDYRIYGITEGRDALGEAVVRIKFGDRIYMGRGVSTDILEASLFAYANALDTALKEGVRNGPDDE